jgi:short-subunit dehydrogenase
MALPPPSPSSTCLVTGASSGIGEEIARELARRGHGVTLVARREDRLDDLAGELDSDNNVRVETVASDVADESARSQMISEIERRGLTVEVLINNAGYGSAGLFHELEGEKEVGMVQVNVEAVVALCAEYAPKMVGRGRGAILNVASTAAFQPLPRQATYSASKAFVLTFTEALHTDLSGTGVVATALCPGPVETEFEEVAGMDMFDKLPSFAMLSAEETAEAAVDALDKGKRAVIPKLTNQATAFSGRFVPRSLLLPLMRRAYLAQK